MKQFLQIRKIIEMVIVNKTEHQEFLRVLENKLIYHMVFTYLMDVFEIVEIAKTTDIFSNHFY